MGRPAPAASRAVEIVLFLTAHPGRGFTLSTLVQRLGINVASAHATLSVLEEAGFVVRDPIDRTYVLGPALAAVGFSSMRQHPAIEASIRHAHTLSQELESVVLVTARAGRDVIFVASRGPEGVVDMPGYPGDRAPLRAPFGAAFIAWDHEDAIDKWLSLGPVDSAVSDHYRRVLDEVRRRGYSVPLKAMGGTSVSDGLARLREQPLAIGADRDLIELLHPGDEQLYLLDDLAQDDPIPVQTITAPIFDDAGTVQLTLSVVGPEGSLTALEVRQIGRRLLRSTSTITKLARGLAPADSA